MEKEQKNNESLKNRVKKDKRKKRVMRITIVVLIAVIILLLLHRCNSGGEVDYIVKTPFDTTVDSDASDIAEAEKVTVEDLNRKVAEGMMTISMNLNPVFATGASEGDLGIVNDESNRYPQIVEIYLNDGDTLLYKSGAVPVGKSVQSGKLLVDLDDGEYDCTAYFNQIDPDTGALLGKAGADVKITIQG